MYFTYVVYFLKSMVSGSSSSLPPLSVGAAQVRAHMTTGYRLFTYCNNNFYITALRPVVLCPYSRTSDSLPARQDDLVRLISGADRGSKEPSKQDR